MIEDVVIKKLDQFIDERGRVMHMLKADDPLFKQFGEIYFSEVLPGVVKAWKRHKKIAQSLAVPVGMIELVIYDDRQNSGSRGQLENIEIGRERYELVRIPPKLWYGFKCISENPALIANCTDYRHDPSEAENRNPYDLYVPYQW